MKVLVLLARTTASSVTTTHGMLLILSAPSGNSVTTTNTTMVSFFIALILINIVVTDTSDSFWDFLSATVTDKKSCWIDLDDVANGCDAVTTTVANCRNYADQTACSKCTTGYGLASDRTTACVACSTGALANAVSCDYVTSTSTEDVVCHDRSTPNASTGCATAMANNCVY